MTTTTATRLARRRMTHHALGVEATRRFGTDARAWLFRCPACQHVQSATELPAARMLDVATACFGCGRTVDEMTGEHRAALLRITLPDGTKTDSFPLADELDGPPAPKAPSGPLTADQPVAATRGPECAESAPAPGCAPVRAASGLTPPSGYWLAGRGWAHEADLDPCACHIAAPCVRCESLQVCVHCPVEVFVPEGDMDAHVAAIHPEIAESEA